MLCFIYKLWYTKCGPLDNTVYRKCPMALILRDTIHQIPTNFQTQLITHRSPNSINWNRCSYVEGSWTLTDINAVIVPFFSLKNPLLIPMNQHKNTEFCVAVNLWTLVTEGYEACSNCKGRNGLVSRFAQFLPLSKIITQILGLQT